MKIAVFGAGAIGGYIAARLALAGEDVTVVARGEKLEAIRRRGLRLVGPGGGDDATARPACVGAPAEAGPQDYVFVATKAHSGPAAAPALAPLLGPGTTVVPAFNGVPWWFFHRLEGPWEGRRLESVDPGGAQWRHIGPERVIGCVVYPAAEVVEPGVVRHIALDRMPVGEPGGGRSERALRLSRAMVRAGMKAPARPRIRDEIWMKLWGAAALNPLSMLTGATLAELVGDPAARAVARAAMAEMAGIGERLGMRLAVSLDRRLDGAGAVGAHKTSTLQDLEAGRPVELEPLIGAPLEIARMVGAAAPTLETLSALSRLRARSAGVWPGDETAHGGRS